MIIKLLVKNPFIGSLIKNEIIQNFIIAIITIKIILCYFLNLVPFKLLIF